MLIELWNSFRRLPLWVQIWVAGILMPINFAALAFMQEPLGLWIALLAVGGMAPNLLIMLAERGLSKAMSLPHIVIWTPLCLLAGWLLLGHADGSQLLTDGYRYFLVALLAIDLISLAFDYPDAIKWWRGDRAIA